MNHSDIDSFLNRLNNGWLEQDYDQLTQCYHADAVLLPPDAGTPIVGRANILDTYRDFHSLAKINRFDVTAVDVFTFADTHMCHMRFDIEYRVADKPLSESGLEVYALGESPALNHQIIWRTQFSLLPNSDDVSVTRGNTS